MAQSNKYDAATFKDNTFEVTFTRMSWADITALTIVHGGVIVWVVIGVVLCLLIVCLICLWKKCSKKGGDHEFYYSEDSYARV
jgi:type III secretory pathway component EscU